MAPMRRCEWVVYAKRHGTLKYNVSCNDWGWFMATSTAQRVQKHREGLRAAGMRPVQIWVPDTRREGFVLECRRQSRLLRGDVHEAETLHWLQAVADTDGWK
jgi:hypothetical protein